MALPSSVRLPWKSSMARPISACNSLSFIDGIPNCAMGEEVSHGLRVGSAIMRITSIQAAPKRPMFDSFSVALREIAELLLIAEALRLCLKQRRRDDLMRHV